MSGVLPGTTTEVGDTVPRTFTPGDTGTAFVVGITERGSISAPQEIMSMSGYAANFGARTADAAILHDTLDVAFRRGLGRAVVLRLVGDAAKPAEDELMDGAGEEAALALKITAASPGAWGNALKWEVKAGDGGGTFRLIVTLGETVVASSPDLADNATAVAWAAGSRWITLTAGPGGDPAVDDGSFSGGADDLEGVDAEAIKAALELFGADLGPGQVAAPGFTTEAVYKALIEHAGATFRTPCLDAEDTAKAGDLLSDAAALKALPETRRAGLFAPWRIVPGPGGTTRTVPPCAGVLGAVAASDRAVGHANVAVAGPAGREPYALGVTQTYTREERAELNAAGVNVAIMDEGQVTNYGWRTLANTVTQKEWISLAAARLMMGLAFGAQRVLKRKEFANLDAQGETVASAEGAIVNEVVSPLFAARAIFGETPEDACSVSVEQVTNPDDGSVGKLTCALSAKPSPYAERIEITVVNVPITESL